MGRAIRNAETVRGTTAPNPWVGALVLGSDGKIYDGATQPPGGLHAERIAIDLAGTTSRGATLVTTLEPCCHEGRTSPCVDHIIEAGLSRVVVGVEDPDPQVAGNGLQALRDAGCLRRGRKFAEMLNRTDVVIVGYNPQHYVLLKRQIIRMLVQL